MSGLRSRGSCWLNSRLVLVVGCVLLAEAPGSAQDDRGPRRIVFYHCGMTNRGAAQFLRDKGWHVDEADANEAEFSQLIERGCQVALVNYAGARNRLKFALSPQTFQSRIHPFVTRGGLLVIRGIGPPLSKWFPLEDVELRWSGWAPKGTELRGAATVQDGEWLDQPNPVRQVFEGYVPAGGAGHYPRSEGWEIVASGALGNPFMIWKRMGKGALVVTTAGLGYGGGGQMFGSNGKHAGMLLENLCYRHERLATQQTTSAKRVEQRTYGFLPPRTTIVDRSFAPYAGDLAPGKPLGEEATLNFSPRDWDRLRFRCRLGQLKSPLALRLFPQRGSVIALNLVAIDDQLRKGREVVQTFADACLSVRLERLGEKPVFSEKCYVRPRPYTGTTVNKEIVGKWESWPGASQHAVTVQVDFEPNRAIFWVDGRAIGTIKGAGSMRKARIFMLEGQTLASMEVQQIPGRGAWVPIDLSAYRYAPSLKLKADSYQAGLRAIDGIPFSVACPEDVVDVGRADWKTKMGQYHDVYHSRCAFWSSPDSVLMSVPKQGYSYAHVLCVLDSTPDKAPVLSFRLTRFLGTWGRGDGMADSSVTFPQGGKRVGTVIAMSKDGERELPLLYAAVPLKCGEIQDVLAETGIVRRRYATYLELELTKQLDSVMLLNYAHNSTKPIGKPSAVHVLGLTLERSPLQIEIGAPQVGNVFYTSEKQALQARIANRTGATFAGRVLCRMTDFDGKSSERVTRFSIPAEGDGNSPFVLDIDVSQAQPGWFSASLRFLDRHERPFWEFPTTVAILPPDTRKSGNESPFGTWWFRAWQHLGTSSIETVGPLLMRAGFRHVRPDRREKLVAADFAPYKVTYSMFTWEKTLERAKSTVPRLVERQPDVKWAIIFHETRFGEQVLYSPEFVGRQPPQLDEKQEAKLKEWWDRGIEISKYYRAHYPDIKLIVGNGTLAFAAELMRRGYPKEYVDAWGNEELAQCAIPEAPPHGFKSLYWLRRYADRYGYSDVPVTACFEWRGRPTHPDELSLEQQAQFYIRDCLKAMSFRAPHINPGLLYDVGNSYYFSRWGATGICCRNPLLNPKPSYVALATLTRELDTAKFVRFVPSPSASLYVMEFDRYGRKTYALWLPQGQRKVTLHFADSTSADLVDMVGRPRRLMSKDGTVTITVSNSPCYVHSPVAIERVEAGPTQLMTSPTDPARVLDPLTSLANWAVATDQDEELEKPFEPYPRCPAKVSVEPAQGDGRRVLKVSLLPQPEIPEPFARYVSLKMKEPREIPGRPARLGVWVKGNSSWGRVRWEFLDAKGRRAYSVGAPCGMWDLYDWKGATFINFDGWNYLSLALPGRYECGENRPSRRHWLIDGDPGNLQYPLRFSRLVLELRDRTFYLNQYIDVSDPAVCVRDLTAEY